MTQRQSPIVGTFYRYHFIGNGAQFRVYAIHTASDVPTGRVIKVALDFNETKLVITPPLARIAQYSTPQELNALADNRAREVMQFKHTLPHLLGGAYGKDRDFMHALGNLRMLQAPIPTQAIPDAYFLPIFYTQDHVATIGGYLRHFRFADQSPAPDLHTEDIAIVKKLVHGIIDLHYRAWEYGFFEFVFKPENMGIRLGKHPEVIWMDLSEHITDKEQAEAILDEKRWHHPLMPHKIDYIYLPKVLHDYYTQACDEAFTVEEFRKRWRKKCSSLESRQRLRLQAQALLMRDDKQVVANWIAQQNLSTTLYQGQAPQQIDNLNIPQSDLILLYNDRRAIKAEPDGEADSLEPIERARANSPTDPAIAYEQLLFKYL